MSDDLSPSRGRLFLLVALATILLAVVGVLGGMHLSRQDRTAARDIVPAPTPATVAPPPSADPRPDCRPETAELAGGPVKSELRIRTRTSAVWICESPDGRLFYHANRGGPGAPWREGETALFLPGVRREAGGYAVTHPDGTVFTVSAERLLVVHADGREEEQPAVQ